MTEPELEPRLELPEEITVPLEMAGLLAEMEELPEEMEELPEEMEELPEEEPEEEVMTGARAPPMA